MAITIKNEHEIALMRESGRLLALVHSERKIRIILLILSTS